MKRTKTEMLHLPVPVALLDEIEDFRAVKRPIPGRLDAVRELIAKGLAADQAREEPIPA